MPAAPAVRAQSSISSPPLLEQVAAPIGALGPSATACASAISATSCADMRSAAQSRKLDRKPWTVMSPRPMRASSCRTPVADGNRRRAVARQSRGSRAPHPTAVRDVRGPPSSAGRDGPHRSARSIRASRRRWTSPVRAAVKIRNSSASAASPRAVQLAHEGADLGVGQRRVMLDGRDLACAGSRLSRWPRHRAGLSPCDSRAPSPSQHALDAHPHPAPSPASPSRSAARPSAPARCRSPPPAACQHREGVGGECVVHCMLVLLVLPRGVMRVDVGLGRLGRT